MVIDNNITHQNQKRWSLHTDFSIIVFLTLEYCLKEDKTSQQPFSHMEVTSHQNNLEQEPEKKCYVEYMKKL